MSNEQTPPQYQAGQEVQTPEETKEYLEQLNQKQQILGVQLRSLDRDVDKVKASIRDVEHEIAIITFISANKLPIYKNKGTN